MSKFVDDLPSNMLREWMDYTLGQRLGGGSGRDVFVYDLDPRYVVKIERSGHQNPVECEIWRSVKDYKQFARWFAPVMRISGYGSVLIMERTLPAPRSAFPKKMPEFVGDLKYSNFGMLRGKLVCHDYGTVTNFLKAMPMKAKMMKASWWDLGDGSSFDDGARPA